MDAQNWFKYFKLQSDENVNNINLSRLVEVIGGLNNGVYIPSKESNYKKGIQKIHNSLKNQGYQITKRQIKTFISSKVNLTGLIKIPYSSYLIFKEIVSLVDVECKTKDFCKKCVVTPETVKCTHCRDLIVADFYRLLDDNSNYLKEKDQTAYNTYRRFYNSDMKCD